MKFYRYEAVEYAVHDHDGELVSPSFPNPTVELREFDLLKETPKGYWIGDKRLYFANFKKWVSKTSRKRFAYPTKEEALTNFIKRNEMRIGILEHQIIFCKMALSIAKQMKEKNEIQNVKKG